MYDFNKIINRKNMDSVKWDVADKAFQGENLIPMWIADMDFEVAPAIVEKMKEKLEQSIFGYGTLSQEYYEAVISWMKRRHDFEVEKDWICYTPGIVSALNFSVEAVTKVGDEVMVITPVYGPFFHAIEDQGRIAVKVPLKNKDGYYTFDFEKMESMVSEKTKAIMLCSPHNPVGRVWDKEELEEFSKFCIRHNLVVIDDEIHHDLVYEKKHTVLGNISEEIFQRSIICTAPSKTFNIAGLQVSNIIIKNEELRNKFRNIVGKHHAFSSNSFASSALIGAYNHSEYWLDELLKYLKGNIDYFVDYIQENIPQLKVQKPEGTYLVWVDCKELGMNQEDTKRFFIEKCKVALNDGTGFGEEGAYYQRFNLACSRILIKQVLENIKTSIEDLVKVEA